MSINYWDEISDDVEIKAYLFKFFFMGSCFIAIKVYIQYKISNF